MQEEALADARSRAVDGRCGRVHALPLPPRLASGRGRHRRRAAEGPLPSSVHRVCPRQRRRAQRLGALDRRLPPARRARPRGQARARACSRSSAGTRSPAGLTLAEAGLAALRRGVRGDRARVALAAPISPGPIESDGSLAARRARRRARARRCAQRSGARAFPPRPSTTRSRCWRSASSAGATRSSRSPAARERFDAILFRHVRSASAAHPRRLSGRTSTSGTATAIAAAGDRTLAARLTPERVAGHEPAQQCAVSRQHGRSGHSRRNARIRAFQRIIVRNTLIVKS